MAETVHGNASAAHKPRFPGFVWYFTENFFRIREKKRGTASFATLPGVWTLYFK